MAYVSAKLLLEKSAKKKKIKTQTYENIKNLWRILGTKQHLLVNFCDLIFKTVFPKHFFFLFYCKLKIVLKYV